MENGEDAILVDDFSTEAFPTDTSIVRDQTNDQHTVDEPSVDEPSVHEPSGRPGEDFELAKETVAFHGRENCDDPFMEGMLRFKMQFALADSCIDDLINEVIPWLFYLEKTNKSKELAILRKRADSLFNAISSGTQRLFTGHSPVRILGRSHLLFN